MATFKVTSSSLNIRSQPKVSSTNRIGVLPQGHVVEQKNKDDDPWWFVSTVFRGMTIEGYVHSNFLETITNFPSPTEISNISEVNLADNKPTIKRSRDGGRAFPLGEPNRPKRDGVTKNEMVAQLGSIIDWLSVDRSVRYLRKGSTTYCNIYAYDYCYLAGVYIPRVWWKQRALLELAKGNSVEVRYGETVSELNANALHDWFEDFGADYGWLPSFDVTECQLATNQGKVVIACAKRVTTNRSGHICAIVPETAQHQAKRTSEEEVTNPLQSQAGSNNFRYKAATKWWTSERFQSFGLWIHD